MNNKIALIYNGSSYQIAVNDKSVTTVNTIEEAYKAFEKTIQNNKSVAAGNWESIRDAVKQCNVEGVEIFEAYHAIEYKTIKYFHNTGKLFCTAGGEMQPLSGDYRLLLFLLEKVAKKQLDEAEHFVRVCAKASEQGIVYSVKDDTFSLYNAIFNYGNVSYNFAIQEIHKGTHTEKGTFNIFKDYVLEVIS